MDGGAQPCWGASFDFEYDPADASAPIIGKTVARLPMSDSGTDTSLHTNKIVILNVRQVSGRKIIATAYDAKSSAEFEVLVDGKAWFVPLRLEMEPCISFALLMTLQYKLVHRIP